MMQSYWYVEGYSAYAQDRAITPEPGEAAETEPGEWDRGQANARAALERFSREVKKLRRESGA